MARHSLEFIEWSELLDAAEVGRVGVVTFGGHFVLFMPLHIVLVAGRGYYPLRFGVGLADNGAASTDCGQGDKKKPT